MLSEYTLVRSAPILPKAPPVVHARDSMASEARKLFQIVLAVALLAAAVRLAMIYYNRQLTAAPVKSVAPPLNADYYVTPHKLYAYDLQSARQLTQQPVWVREGYKYTYYPYEPHTRRVDFNREAGMLLPLEHLQITDLVLARLPQSPLKPGEKRVNPYERQVMAVFTRDGRSYAVPIGLENDNQYHIYADEIFYLQDPHELYKHWSSEVWQAIDRHQLKPGMNELQASFAVGMGVTQTATANNKVVRYDNGGHRLLVSFSNGLVTSIEAQPH